MTVFKKCRVNAQILIFLFGIFLIFLFFSCTKHHLNPDLEDGILVEEKPMYIFQNDTLRYRIISPENMEVGRKYPLVLFCHGAGQRGNDNESQMADLPPLLLNEFGKKHFPCYILIPQVPLEEQWVNVSWQDSSHVMPDTIANVELLTLKLLDSLKNNISIDTNRIYVTGLSMGGFGTWDLICRYPQKFAAAVPVAGGGDENEAIQLVNIPIWAFHGADDDVVLSLRSVNMVNAVNNAGGNARLTVYPNVGHWSWNLAYDDVELFSWLFQQSR